jgi:hypothetical protein
MLFTPPLRELQVYTYEYRDLRPKAFQIYLVIPHRSDLTTQSLATFDT